ncbi:CDGP domain-containing protein [Candidatus Mycolicibacterium alkanivorans]
MSGNKRIAGLMAAGQLRAGADVGQGACDGPVQPDGSFQRCTSV